MALSQDDLQRAEEGILRTLQNSEIPFSPTRLMRQLEDQEGISEYSTRVAIWYLIDRNLIELTMDRLLRSVRQDSEAAVRLGPVLAGG